MMSRKKQLCFSLEKAHPNTVGIGYEERAREQDAYLKGAFSISKNNPDILLALLYSLSRMHEDTYAALIGNSRSLLKFELMPKLINQLAGLDMKAIIKASSLELITFEIKRVAAAHATGATTLNANAHEKKNFRFIIELDALLHESLLKKHFSEDDAQASQDFMISDEIVYHERERNPNETETVTETDTGSDLVFRRAVNLGEYWNIFLNALEISMVTPAALMTTTLIKFSQSLKNIKPLLDWQKALEEYYRDPYGLLPEASKRPARIEFEKIKTWCVDKTIEVSGPRDLTGSGMNMYLASPRTSNGGANVLNVQSVA